MPEEKVKLIWVKGDKIYRHIKICRKCNCLFIGKEDIERYFCKLETVAGTMRFNVSFERDGQHVLCDQPPMVDISDSDIRMVKFIYRQLPEGCKYRMEQMVMNEKKR